MEYGIYIGGATLAIAVIAHAVRITLWVGRIDKEAREYMDAQIDNMQRDILTGERNGLNRADTIRSEFGETASALRQKIHEVETWNRDTFVRKESFELVITRIENAMGKATDAMNKTMDKIESRIEALITKSMSK